MGKGRPIDKKEFWRLILEHEKPPYKLSEASGLNGSTLPRILRRGRARPATIDKLAKFFAVKPTALLKDIDYEL